MTSASTADKLEALRKILVSEAQGGYADKTVIGGLDAFLRTLGADAQGGDAALRALADRGMLAVDYAALDPPRRKRWSEEVGRIIGAAAPPPALPLRGRKAAPDAKRPRKAAPAPAPRFDLDADVSVLRAVTAANRPRLARLGVRAVRDLVFLFPNRHLDYSRRRSVAQVRPGEEQTIVVTLWEAHELRLGREGRLRASEAVVGDDTGNIRAMWFGQPWVAGSLNSALERAQRAAAGPVRLVLSGKASVFQGRAQMDSPEWEVVDDAETAASIHTGRLVPVYPSTERMPQRTMRRIVREALDRLFGAEGARNPGALPDPLDAETLRRRGLPALGEAVLQAHYPDDEEAKERARQRLAFDELLTLQLALGAQRRSVSIAKSISLPPRSPAVAAFVRSLPFTLTEGQRGALREVMRDIEGGDKPMSRLLQGDVGAGKTVVALAALLAAAADGRQGALMAPTEVLAEQHFMTVRRLLGGLDQQDGAAHRFACRVDGRERPIEVGLLTGSLRAKARREVHERAGDGSLDLLIGTHALLQEEVSLPNLALAVVDEQHRFGVVQRAALRAKGPGAGIEPHLLVMSATPIPRTLALTLYGDLDVSTIRGLPPGRPPVRTHIVQPERREDAEAFLVTQAREGRQSFVLCPLIDESEAVQARAATEEYERLRGGSLAGVRVGLLL
ncbi:MAG: DEAD/DEAH box helicase [Chloroflexota bacterium]|nr:DEAD/DEAH box helicase [Chloroflexota bacterium]